MSGELCSHRDLKGARDNTVGSFVCHVVATVSSNPDDGVGSSRQTMRARKMGL
jgi:hypothetical protein